MYLTSDQPPWFVFIVHPRDVAETLTMPGGAFVRRYSESDEEFVNKLEANPPVVCAEVTFAGSPVRGEIIGVPLLPQAILTPAGNRAVVDASLLAAERGAGVVGLGALTAPATAGGRALLRHVPRNVTITNGNGLTAAIAYQNAREVLALLDDDRDPRIGVLGATGSVGCALSHLLADDDFELILIGTSQARVEQLLGPLLDRAIPASGLASLMNADIVLVLTNDPSATLTADLLSPGAWVIDVAQPHNIDDAALPAFAERDVTVVRGGTVQIPGYSCSWDFRLPMRHHSFACLAETYLLAREGIREHSVGRPSSDYARRIAALAGQHGILPCPLAAGRELASTYEVGRRGLGLWSSTAC
jgi:fatty aldehyde-generating acyl-ACP reductase